MDDKAVTRTEPKIKMEENTDGDDDDMTIAGRINLSGDEQPSRITIHPNQKIKIEHHDDDHDDDHDDRYDFHGLDPDFEPQDLEDLEEGEVQEPKEQQYRLKTPRKGAATAPKRAMEASEAADEEIKEEAEETVDDLKEDLTILEADRIKQQRAMKKRPTAADGIKLQSIDVEIQNLKRKIKEMSSGDNGARAKVAKNAQEYWAEKYGKDQRVFKYLNLKKRGKRSAAPKASPVENKKLRGEAGKAVRKGKDDDATAMKVMKTTEPFKAMAMIDPSIPSPGAILLDSKANLCTQLVEIKKFRASESDPLARDQKTVLKQAVSSFGFRRCSLVEGTYEDDPAAMRWKLKGFRSRLYNHQVVGSSWMVSRELCPQGPHGGILGDEMGLGKTVQVLACMAANPPMEEDVKAGAVATLIVVPAASLSQWVNEIRKHSYFEAFVYNKAASRTSSYKLWSRAPIV